MSTSMRTVKTVARRAIKRPWRAHGLVLMYHRVATSSWDPWGNCVDPERFEQHLAVLSRVADFVPMSEFASRLHSGRRKRPVVALTFDDGYADNLYAALPLLERYSAPATVFVATAWTDRGEPFWWDRLLGIVRSMEPLPSEVRLPIAGEEFVWRLPTDSVGFARDRDRLHVALWSRLASVTDRDRSTAMNLLETLAIPANSHDADGMPMTRDELRRLASSPLIEIGAHTMSHCRLPDLPPEVQFEEIAGSRQQCREIVGEFPSSFAYPFGDVDTVTPELVRSAGFERACSSEEELVWEGSDAMLMPRVPVLNYTSREFVMRLRMKWLP